MKALKKTDFLWLFGFPTLLNYIACQVAIPYMELHSQLPIEIIYFICVGGLVLLPMFIWAIYLTGKEIGSFELGDILRRMRIKFSAESPPRDSAAIKRHRAQSPQNG
jgi:hypothetical protein